MRVEKLQQQIESHICVVVVPNNPENPTEQLSKALTELQLSENELKKVKWFKSTWTTQNTLENKEKHLHLT